MNTTLFIIMDIMQFNSPTDAAIFLQNKLIAGDIHAVQSFRHYYEHANSVMQEHKQMLPYYVLRSANTDMYEYALSSNLIKGISYLNTAAEQQQLNLLCAAVCKTNETFLNIMSWSLYQLQKEKSPDYDNYKTEQIFDVVSFIASQYFVMKEDTEIMKYLLDNPRSTISDSYVLLHNSAINFDKSNMLDWLYKQRNIQDIGKQYDAMDALKKQKNNLCTYFNIGHQYLLFGNNLQDDTTSNNDSIISIALQYWENNIPAPYYSQLIEKDFHSVVWDETNIKMCMQLLKKTSNYALSHQLSTVFIQSGNTDAIKLLKKTKFEDDNVKSIIKNALFSDKLQKSLPTKSIKTPTRKI